MVGIHNYVKKACEEAVQETADIAHRKLQECISEQYYNDPEFSPKFYKRTEEFLNHAAYQILSSGTAEIYVDTEGMHYKNNFNAWQVVEWASMSMHGGEKYKTSTMDFWTAFIEWCDNNLISVLKTNLRKHGVSIK